MSDTSMGTRTVTPSINFLTHTWQPRRDLRRKHEVRLICSHDKGRNSPPTLGCLVQAGFSLKFLLKVSCAPGESSSRGTTFPGEEVPGAKNLPQRLENLLPSAGRLTSRWVHTPSPACPALRLRWHPAFGRCPSQRWGDRWSRLMSLHRHLVEKRGSDSKLEKAMGWERSSSGTVWEKVL